MARNYYKLWTSRVNLGGNYYSFIGETEEDVTDQTNTFITTNGGTADWNGRAGYFLIKKEMVLALLQNWVVHYPSALGSQWRFFQDGLFPSQTPFKGWKVLGE